MTSCHASVLFVKKINYNDTQNYNFLGVKLIRDRRHKQEIACRIAQGTKTTSFRELNEILQDSNITKKHKNPNT